MGGQGGGLLTLKVTHGNFTHDVEVPSSATFGDVKAALVEEAFLMPPQQRLLFRGHEVTDGQTLLDAGVKDGAKLMLLENHAPKDSRSAEERREAEELAKATQQIGVVRNEVDGYAKQVAAYSAAAAQGGGVDPKALAAMAEMLMRQLLKLDGIRAEGDAKLLRRSEVKRVQELVDEVDRLKTSANHASTGKL
eukprot:TRINITY_DN3503_c0_g2_i2.p2 TRINITY_DN3503_c0_g2~~TRINITY_DN3503_c0_g2_i2.p2  ORF type:complete len:193 (+),score=56.52 TRINITY_DN3503_c0_g2_i2:257-835(+)